LYISVGESQNLIPIKVNNNNNTRNKDTRHTTPKVTKKSLMDTIIKSHQISTNDLPNNCKVKIILKISPKIITFNYNNHIPKDDKQIQSFTKMIDNSCQIEPLNITEAHSQTFLTNNDIKQKYVD